MSKSFAHPDDAEGPRTGHASESGESAFLDWVRDRQRRLLGESHSVLVGAGDDLAVLRWPGGLVLLGMDPVLDGVHVEMSVHGPAAAGRKAVNRNLSDVAAMGAEPVAAVLSLVVPRSMTVEDVQHAYVGAEEAGTAARCPIVGGDFSSWEGRLVVTVGILARAEAPLLRAGSPERNRFGREGPQIGETIFVTGPLGGSISGRHLSFEPRLALGRRIARELGATAMLDISDGLSRDLPRLLGADLGATIDAARLPVHEDAVHLARQTGREPLWHALHDGEDYELLFTAPVTSLPDCTAIGRVEREPGLRLQRSGRVEPVPPEGWEHRLHPETCK